MSTAYTREHWAKLSTDRKEAAGFIATGSCRCPKLSKICRGVKSLSEARLCRSPHQLRLQQGRKPRGSELEPVSKRKEQN